MQVACRQLGFLGAKRFYTHGGGTGPTWLDDVNCRGTEKSLLECKHRGIGVENCGKVFKELKFENFVAPFLQTYPGYQRFFLACDGELRFVCSRPTRVWPKAEETAHEKPLAPRVLQTRLTAKNGLRTSRHVWVKIVSTAALDTLSDNTICSFLFPQN